MDILTAAKYYLDLLKMRHGTNILPATLLFNIMDESYRNKPTMWYMCPDKTQINLGFHLV